MEIVVTLVQNVSSEQLKCCKLCPAFATCDHKGECCPECTYFDEKDYLCLAPEKLKKELKEAPKKKREFVVEDTDDEVDPETFLFEDDDDEEEESDGIFNDDDDEDFDFIDDWE